MTDDSDGPPAAAADGAQLRAGGTGSVAAALDGACDAGLDISVNGFRPLPAGTASGETTPVGGPGSDRLAAFAPPRVRPDPRPAGRARADRYAALDLGTNNCRLLVAEPLPSGFRVIDAFSRIVRLGEGLSRTGRLGEAAMERAIEALKVCRRKMTDRDVTRARLIATEACRAASNGRAFLERVRREVGLELEIVDRETEARLAVAGCASLLDRRCDGAILFDIGGGSSELVWLDFRRTPPRPGRGLARSIRAWASLPVGVVTLSERHGGVTVTPAVFETMVQDVRALLAAFPERDKLCAATATGRMHLLGTSGTVTTLAGVHLGLARYDRRRVDGTWMSADEVSAMMQRIIAMDFDARVASPCIGAERADLVLAGCAILEAIRREWPCGRLRVADRGLREGILVELMSADRVWERARRRYRRQGQANGNGHA